MTELRKIVEIIEKIAPPGLASDWDNSGLQVGDPNSEVSGVLVALDPLPEVVAEAARLGCNLALAHHPLFFRPVKRLDASSGAGAVAHAAVRAGIAIYSAHTSFDRVPDGVSAALAELLGIKKTAVLEQADGWPKGYGYGRVGSLARKTTAGAFAKAAKVALGLPHAKLVGDPNTTVSRVALCGGSGSDLMGLAKASGAELFVTGDLKYHEALGALDAGLCVLDVGHFGSEHPAVARMAGLLRSGLKKDGIKLAVYESGVQTEPWDVV